MTGINDPPEPKGTDGIVNGSILQIADLVMLLNPRLMTRTYMHWTAVSAARGASRVAELAAKVTMRSRAQKRYSPLPVSEPLG